VCPKAVTVALRQQIAALDRVTAIQDQALAAANRLAAIQERAIKVNRIFPLTAPHWAR